MDDDDKDDSSGGSLDLFAIPMKMQLPIHTTTKPPPKFATMPYLLPWI